MPDHLFEYWGKARPPEDSEGPDFHPLVYHCLDVAAVAAVWLQTDEPLRAAFVRVCAGPREKVLAWTLFFVALHDLGKWDVRFQLKAPVVALALNPLFSEADSTQATKFDHGGAGYAWFVHEQSDYELGGDDEESSRQWMRAVAGHHGSLPWDTSRRPPSAAPEVIACDREARRQWVDLLRATFLEPAGILPSEEPPPLSRLLAGLCCVADWLGSNPDYFPYTAPGTLSPRDYFDAKCSDGSAERALHDSGVWRSPAAVGGMKTIYPDLRPRGVQRLVDALPVEAGLTIVEAPTGSGKTEAALAYAAHLLAAGLADSVVFALPTQATANAMFARMEEIGTKLFPSDVSLVLAHGKARFNHRFQNLKKAALGPTVQRSEDAYTQCARWLAQGRKRVFLGQIGVCTVDQVLLGALPVRHNFVRRFGVHKSVLIVDEVHAYDTYMNTLLDRVLTGQREAGGSAILLSATLPSSRRDALMALWNGNAGPEGEAAYPLVTHAGSEQTRTWEPDDAPEERIVEVRIDLTADMTPSEAVLDEIVLAAESGAKVALVCNLVADAQAAYRDLSERTDVPVDLFHSRFRFEDRGVIESDVLAHYGKKAPRGVGRILVATQVVEQSLDLDFDWMITQLCPVELLFQRLGRLHRHKHDIPRAVGYQTPRCTVVAPPGTDYGFHALVYANARHLWRTHRLLEQEPLIRFPCAYRKWLEQVFDATEWPNEPDDVLKAFERFEQDEFAARYKALGLSADDIGAFADTEGNASCLTRDGEMSWNVVPVVAGETSRVFIDGQRLDDLYEDWERDWALDRNTIPVPHGWARVLPKAEDGIIFLPTTLGEDDLWRAELDEVTLTYSPRLGLERRNNK